MIPQKKQRPVKGQVYQQQPQLPQPPQQQPYPSPAPPVVPTGPQSPFRGPGYVPPATPAPAWGEDSDPNFTGQFNAGGPQDSNFYGGQQIAGAQPGQADYQSVQQYSDAAHENAMRYLQPQIDQQNRGMEQQLINKGVDPNSEQGRQMMAQMGRQQADARNAAAFGSMQFGQGIQNQMAAQEQAKAQLAGQMRLGQWGQETARSGQNLQKYLGDQNFALGSAGLQNQYNLGRSGQDLQRYGMDLSNQLGQGQLDLSRQGQDFNQMMGLEGMDFRNRQYGDQQQQYQDQLIMAMMGMTPIPGVAQISPQGAYNTGVQSAGQDKGFLGNWI